ncbi:hypothetical protein EDEG_02128 [Edhazardia aedis USNM 41457]|uniref:Uncharacterized protein n=1 Tax=Edhazardia aedis (strain USNM 41457) TaxID=1003232 RepID=J9D7S1_EDHAE|nr:hypothetical protein EDEG_02128 [Edhazardia aedis USNM 41457]|eukprot:EJW03544.1 hypothetical protein EDEG_02128 [Edhazardia aedis USNM 41457]
MRVNQNKTIFNYIIKRVYYLIFNILVITMVTHSGKMCASVSLSSLILPLCLTICGSYVLSQRCKGLSKSKKEKKEFSFYGNKTSFGYICNNIFRQSDMSFFSMCFSQVKYVFRYFIIHSFCKKHHLSKYIY